MALVEIVEDPPALADAVDERREVIVEQDERRGLAGDVGASLPHGEADMRRLERRGIVDPVAGHGDDLSAGLQGVHEAQLLLRDDAREDVRRT